MMKQINVDTSLCVDSLLPHIVAHFNQVKKTFRQIDKLESAVKKVEKSVSSMETELNTAETYLESESVFKTVFKPFLVTPKVYTSS
jgi:tetrahydromethanopterin S-methyltransferase subunit B